MIRLAQLAAMLVLAFGSVVCAEDGKGKPVPIPLYDGFEADQASLRKTTVLRAGPASVNASSADACLAAKRIFERVPFLFRTRAEVLKRLGDPATVSDYGQSIEKDAPGSLVYVFDTGFGGLQYTLTLGQLDVERVIQVRIDSRD